MKRAYIYFIVFLLFSSGIIACSQGNDGSSSGAIQLQSPKEYQDSYLANSNAQLVDVRTPGEFSDGHLPGFMNIDFYEESFKSQLDELDRDKPVYVYCAVGGRSGQAASLLEEMGFKEIHDLKGGIKAWGNNDLPIEK